MADTQDVRACVLSRVRLFVTLLTVALQAPLSTGILQARTGVGCHFLLQRNLPNPGIKPACPVSPALQGDSTC